MLLLLISYIKVSEVGRQRQQLSCEKLIHGDKSQLWGPADCLSLPSISAGCLEAPSLIALSARLPQSSLLNVVNSDLIICCYYLLLQWCLLFIPLLLIAICIINLLIPDRNHSSHRTFSRLALQNTWSNLLSIKHHRAMTVQYDHSQRLKVEMVSLGNDLIALELQSTHAVLGEKQPFPRQSWYEVTENAQQTFVQLFTLHLF